MAKLLKLAVIGAGPAGLATARELKKEGHEVVVYEKSDQIGGLWVYDPRVEEDPLGLDPNRKIIHGSMYHSLRTNIPRCVLGFSDYPFPARKNPEESNFPGHAEVLEFLKDFVRDFELDKLIRFNTEVVRVEQVTLRDNNMWLVESKGSDMAEESSLELFEAVVVCSGHYTQPRIAQLAGNENWPGKQIHSHNYRHPEPYRDQVVIIIGLGPSTFDISVEVAKVAKEVHISTRRPWDSGRPWITETSKYESYDNIWLHPEVVHCDKNGEIAFKDGSFVAAEIIIYCTGYNYYYPFLRTKGAITIDDNRVGPLYKHIFPPQLSPTLCFVGVPRRALNCRMFDLQAKWVAQVLSGKMILPSKEEMLADVEQHYKDLERQGVPIYYTHEIEFDCTHLNWLASLVGVPPLDELHVEIFNSIPRIHSIAGTNFREYSDAWLTQLGF